MFRGGAKGSPNSKDQVEKTANSMPSVLLVEKARQIEKLAKPIKDLAKG
jgi:hypothetical protein